MLTQEQVIEAIKGGRESDCLDGRDYGRLCDFFPVEQWDVLGFKLSDGQEPPETKPWTEEAIIEAMRGDVEFGFEKAINQRGLSASTMHSVVKTWLWVLDVEIDADYAQYGLPLLKAVALKYGFDNPIGDEAGNESKYASSY